MPRTKRPKVLRLNVDIFITEDEWDLVNLIMGYEIQSTFSDAFRHQTEHGNINEIIGLPWQFVARYFDITFCRALERFEDKMLDRHNEGIY
jgi:hypothetical protein